MIVVDSSLKILATIPMGVNSRIFPISNTEIIKNETAKIIMIRLSNSPAIWRKTEFKNKQMVSGFIYYWRQNQTLIRFRQDARPYLFNLIMSAEKYNQKTNEWEFCLAPKECINWLQSQLGYCSGY